MTKKLGLALAVLSSLGLFGCGDDDGGGGGGSGNGSGAGTSGGAGRAGSTGGGSGSGGSSSTGSGSGSSTGDAASCLMTMTGNTSNIDCDLTDYSDCVVDTCGDEIGACLGADWESGDFGGSLCEALCAAPGSVPPGECLNCLLDLSQCSSNCELPACALEGAGGAGGSGAAGAGGLPASDKTCDDLEACCNSLDAQIMNACLMQFDLIKGQGDAACGAVYSGFAALGCM